MMPSGFGRGRGRPSRRSSATGGERPGRHGGGQGDEDGAMAGDHGQGYGEHGRGPQARADLGDLQRADGQDGQEARTTDGGHRAPPAMAWISRRRAWTAAAASYGLAGQARVAAA